METVIRNWSCGEVEYCAKLCISLQSFGVLAAGRLKYSILDWYLLQLQEGFFLPGRPSRGAAELYGYVASRLVTRYGMIVVQPVPTTLWFGLYTNHLFTARASQTTGN